MRRGDRFPDLLLQGACFLRHLKFEQLTGSTFCYDIPFGRNQALCETRMMTVDENDHQLGQHDARALVAAIPKAELHVHLEGCLHPNLIQKLATRNEVTIKLDDAQSTARQQYNLETFLQIYFDGIRALVSEHDFYDVVCDYAEKAAQQNVMHVEMFFDPQAHLARGVEFQTIIAGVRRAANYAREELNISMSLIMCFLREESVDSAMRILDEAGHFKDLIIGVGLDGDSTKSSARDFNGVFQKARDMGFFTTSHCDKMPSDSIEQIRQALLELKVDRLDHASCILENEWLTTLVKDKQMGITCCPNTNVLLHGDTEVSVVRQMLACDVKCSIHSDDPGYFKAYINENLQALSDEGLSIEDIVQLSRNSIESSWATPERKKIMLSALNSYMLQMS